MPEQTVLDLGPDRAHLIHEDAEARRAAETEFSRPVVVEAGAGTGKTSILVARIVAWAVGPGWERAMTELGTEVDDEEIAAHLLAGVVAITFTEAAAAEMAERVSHALSAIEAGQLPIGVSESSLPRAELLRPRAVALLTATHRMHVRTIHSFCQWLLRSYPVEARIDPAFTVDPEGLRLEALIFDVVDEAVRQAFTGKRDPDWIELVGFGVGPPEVAAALQQLVESGAPPSAVAAEPFSTEALGGLLEELRQALTDFWDIEAGCLGKISVPVARATIEALEDLDRETDEVPLDADALRRLAAALPEREMQRLGDWGKGRFGKREAAALSSSAASLTVASATLEQALLGLARLRPRELQAARKLILPLLETVYEQMRAQGLLTYTGLLTEARDLLQRSPMLCSLVRESMTQLLVDEFQDTDSIQCEIISLLALKGPVRRRPGLFIVGDPKQSIYGWRNADLLAYERFVDLVVASGGRRYRLSVNFRSVPPVLDEVERVVRPVMIDRHGLQPPFQPLVACTARAQDSGFVAGRWAPVEHWISWPGSEESGSLSSKGKASDATELEALALAQDLAALHDQAEQEWSEMAVLLRSGSDLDVYLEALREAGVPYAVSREREYFRRREVVDAAALVRWLIEPSDQLALLTLLRSDVVGVPDAALVPLWRQALMQHLLELDRPDQERLAAISELVRRAGAEVPAEAPGAARLDGWESGLILAIESLAALRASLRRDPPDLFVERLRSLWLSEATAAARYLGSFRRARLERFFSELERELVDGDGQLTGVARFLRRAVAREQESQEPSLPETITDAVQVMTIHGAKGLDFKHVYLMQLHKGLHTGGAGQPAEVLIHDGRAEYSLFGWPTPAFLSAGRWAEQVEQAERVRLLYVAMTRAKDRLVMAGKWSDSPGWHEPAQVGRLLELVEHRCDDAAFQDQADQGIARTADDSGALWVLPALEVQETTARPVTSLSYPGGPIRRIRDHAELLAGKREQARLRMQRPCSTPASAEAHHQLELESRAEHQLATAVPAGSGSREISTTIGTTVHFLLETIDLSGDLGAQIEERRNEMYDRLAGALDSQLKPALKRFDEICDLLARGECLARLQELAPDIVARELPLLLPPPQTDTGPVGFIAGTADLVYRDPATGELVVADYKTDQVTDPEAVTERARGYQGQGRIYCRAVQEALGLETEPPFELWFLAADQIIRL
jgi:ATP-dependent helicase/nuclease subunit A